MDNLKFIIIGDCGVGKSCLIHYFIHQYYCNNERDTIVLEYENKIVQIDQRDVKLCLWDLSGNIRYKELTTSFYEDVQGIILVYDITNVSSFNDIPYWIQRVKPYISSNTKILLIGNKLDLHCHREVPKNIGKKYAQDHGFSFIETSCKNGTNINNAIIQLGTDILNDNHENKENKSWIQYLHHLWTQIIQVQCYHRG